VYATITTMEGPSFVKPTEPFNAAVPATSATMAIPK